MKLLGLRVPNQFVVLAETKTVEIVNIKKSKSVILTLYQKHVLHYYEQCYNGKKTYVLKSPRMVKVVRLSGRFVASNSMLNSVRSFDLTLLPNGLVSSQKMVVLLMFMHAGGESPG